MGAWGFVKKAFGFVDSFFILKSLSLYQYGVYQLLLSFYALISDFFHDLFGQVSTNDISRYMGEGKHSEAKRMFFEYTLFRLFMAVIPTVVAFFTAPYLSFRYGPDAILWIKLLALLFVVDAVLNLFSTFLKLHLEFKVIAVRPSFQKLIQAIILGYFYFFSVLSIKEIFLAQLIAPSVIIIIMLPVVFRVYQHWRFVPMAKEGLLSKSVFAYGLWEIPQLATRNLVGKIRPWAIKLFLNTEAVGIFGVAYTAVSILKDFLPVRTLTTLVPHKAASPEGMRALFFYGTKYYVLLSLVLFFCGLVGYPIAIKMFFPNMADSIPLFYVLAPIIVLFAFTKIANVFLVVRRRQKFIFFNSVLEHGLGVLGIFVFVPWLGVIGLGFAECFSALLAVIIKYSYLSRTKFIEKIYIKDFFKYTEMDKEILHRIKTHLMQLVGRQLVIK